MQMLPTRVMMFQIWGRRVRLETELRFLGRSIIDYQEHLKIACALLEEAI